MKDKKDFLIAIFPLYYAGNKIVNSFPKLTTLLIKKKYFKMEKLKSWYYCENNFFFYRFFSFQ